MMFTQRRIVLILIAIQLAGVLLFFLSQLAGLPTIASAPLEISGIATLVYGGLFWAYWQGWDYARFIMVAIVTLLVGVGLQEPFLLSYASIGILFPPLIALVVAGPLWVVGSSVAVLSILIVRAGGTGVYLNISTLIVYAMLVGGLILSRLVMETAQRAAEQETRRAEEALARTEQQAAETERKAEELSRRNEEQQRLLNLVATLETPAVALAEGVLLAPIVGHLDSRRAQALTGRLLEIVGEQRTEMVIIDIAGVSTVDTEVAQALLRTAQSLRLLGCAVTITGISASVAITITHLGISLEEVATARTPREALATYLVKMVGPVSNGGNHGSARSN